MHSNRLRKILTFFFFPKIILPFSKEQHFVAEHYSTEELKRSVKILGKDCLSRMLSATCSEQWTLILSGSNDLNVLRRDPV